MKLDILAIGAHPDDVELGCGGTLAKMISENKKVGILDLTEGELGTRGTALTRKSESEEASKILSIAYRENLKFRDGFFKNDDIHQIELIKIIRKYKPDIVLANAVNDRHPDHGKAAKLVYDACFLSGLLKIQTSYNGVTQDKWRPKHIFNYIQWNEEKPDFIIDISHFLDKKIEACMAYKTQFYDPNSLEPNTPITSINFKKSIIYRAENLGRLIGCDAGEGFTSQKWIGLKDFENFV
ncbi:bacillithiol biosynthesis deacetylase BshB1 [Apibacter sp. B3706]|uniref:bacillithiol biosynthesis deacetylase BshB1 n=1 Tax=unclassified Apibacter TaxID=2630820 RepID=UPI00135D891E|nr:MULTISPECIES: bacillithiol biosynthesis deacetylase BshB1 [unclassified Apibacter]MXP06081.1 bacillithiol biosynthesis deacetylase BshB1 [Apibacter sp. B3546]MXP12966.1 bacillithiol biosynthesis deacetylase BshB1 [Apibacter sp. B3239]QII70479.1 bacillithiol biosynthesis deacetylase BshB1 [Apibacter sp. B3706]